MTFIRVPIHIDPVVYEITRWFIILRVPCRCPGIIGTSGKLQRFLSHGGRRIGLTRD